MSEAVKPKEESIQVKTDKTDQTDKIDYLHPDGKPQISEEQRRINKEEQKKPVSQQALQEADGHHVCTEECLGHKHEK